MLQPVIFQTYAKLYAPFNWAQRGSEAILSLKCLQKDKFAFPSESNYPLIFLFYLLKGMVPLRGFEPVTPSLRMELGKPVKAIYYNGLSSVLVLPKLGFQALPKFDRDRFSAFSY